ncbi:MAG: DUF4384 domain-containing protein [Bryobacteraceae bacterium]|nr:DUF4384 domain-containing protein [Bryobacteraceae bacterium]
MNWLTTVALLFQATPAVTPPAGTPASIVEVNIEQQSVEQWKVIDSRTVFKPGDEIRFRFQSTMGGYVYVVNRSPAGEYRRLFPTGETGSLNRIDANRPYTVPSSDGSFVIPPNPGFETIFWVLSPTPMVEDVIARSLPGRTKSTLIPKCDPGPLTARGACIDSSAGAKAPPKGSGLTSRDLNPDGTPESAAVRFVGLQERALVYEFWIAHH